MLIVRYVALAALVVWLGGMVVVRVLVAPAIFDVLQSVSPEGRTMAGALAGEVFRELHLVAYVCGTLLFLSLFIMKFVGPPPVGFLPRTVIVAAMLASAAYSGVVVLPQIDALHTRGAPGAEAPALHQQSVLLMTLNIALGSVLLYWYARE